MFLRDLHIQNLKLLRDFRLSFEDVAGEPRMWTVLIGENGTAKSSILQAIAMASAGRLLVNSLAKPVIGQLYDRRRLEDDSDEPMRITARFAAQPSSDLAARSLEAQVTLQRNQATLRVDHPAGNVTVDDLDEHRASNTGDLFVAAYGVSRFLPAPTYSSSLQQPAIERMESLFQPRAALHSLAFAELFPAGPDASFAKVLRDALQAHEALAPMISGIELRGSGGVKSGHDLLERDRFECRLGANAYKLPATALSHGYQSILAWISDFIGHAMLVNPELRSTRDIHGVALIDEIDAFLHPVWQAGLVDALRAVFPNVQFVVSTHSPVILAGVRREEIVRLGHDRISGDVVRMVHERESGLLQPLGPDEPVDLSGEPDPRTLTGTAIYRDWFGVDRLTLHPQGETLQEYSRIATDPFRTDAEETQLGRLKAVLAQGGIQVETEPSERLALPGAADAAGE